MHDDEISTTEAGCQWESVVVIDWAKIDVPTVTSSVD